MACDLDGMNTASTFITWLSLGLSMLAAFVGTSGVELRDVPEPVAGPGEAVVRMMACGVCGTDLEKAHGRGLTQAVLGHEVSGVVEMVGEDVKDLRPGERVFVHHHVSCGKCYYCLAGSYTMCQLFKTTNIVPGGFSELFRVPEPNVERGGVIPIADMDFDLASFIEPLACCLRSLHRVGFTPGWSAGVIGYGPAGALHVMAMKALGASYVAVADISDFRLEMAVKLGADEAVNIRSRSFSEVCRAGTDGRGVDLVVVSTGNPAAFRAALDAVRRGGKICLFGAPPKSSTVDLDISKLFIDELSVIPNYSTTERETWQAFQLLRAGVIKPLSLITHRYPLARVREAFEKAASPESSMKVIVHP
jgi:L-iditol 2-dehydrogenase